MYTSTAQYLRTVNTEMRKLKLNPLSSRIGFPSETPQDFRGQKLKLKSKLC